MRGGNCLRYGTKGMEDLLWRNRSQKKKKIENSDKTPLITSYIDGVRIMRYKREPLGFKFILFLENGEKRKISIFDWMRFVTI